MHNRFRQVFFIIGMVLAVAGLSSCALFESKEVSKGRKLFGYYCAHCHGEKGNGKGYNAPNLDPHPRDLTDRVEAYMADATNEDVFLAIKNGLAGVVWPDGTIKPGMVYDEEYGFGSTLMPYWGNTLSDEEIWALVAFVRTLHSNDAEKITIPAEDLGTKKSHLQLNLSGIDFDVKGPRRQALIERGENLYDEKYACSGCHSINGEGGEVAPDLARAGFRFNPEWIYRWVQYASSIKHTKMPNFGMPEEDALAVTLYLGTLK